MSQTSITSITVGTIQNSDGSILTKTDTSLPSKYNFLQGLICSGDFLPVCILYSHLDLKDEKTETYYWVNLK